MMKTRSILAFGLVALTLISSIGITAAASVNQTDSQTAPAIDTITPFRGTIGPDHSLYGIKIAFENLDESFTVNESERLEKQVAHADNRLAELKFELAENKTDAADRALELYRQKLNQTENVLGQYAPNGTGTKPGADDQGLEHAREMILKHQGVLMDLLNAHPDNPGLSRAYNNSLVLEQKFENKLEQRTETRNRQMFGPDNTTLIRKGNPDSPQNRTLSQDELRIHDEGLAENSSRPDPGMSQTINASNPGRSQNKGVPLTINQTDGSQQQSNKEKTLQNGQGNTRDNTGNSQNSNTNDDNADRNTGSGSGNTGSPGNDQNGNANGNNGGANTGTTRDIAKPNGQGGDKDLKVKNR
ncbi:DUF5667 domain-containing protein [Methanoregula sp.]|uniref:DUF5667 domain-containing protein n=1 Tax=Methanoregula sp. TaxID=2052170 RepID=UPI003566F25B